MARMVYCAQTSRRLFGGGKLLPKTTAGRLTMVKKAAGLPSDALRLTFESKVFQLRNELKRVNNTVHVCMYVVWLWVGL